MNVDSTLFSYFLNASLVVKFVMLLLAGASVLSWAYILQRSFYLRDISKSAGKFEHSFWAGEDLNKIYMDENRRRSSLEGMEAIFFSGYREFLRFRKQAGASLNNVMDNTRRAMRVATMREQNKLEKHLQFLAIVGSTSPFIGIFGTVWGIMQAFRSLANVQQATIAMVAPGISEALIATAFGLFAAIPAVIAYNRFVNDINRLLNRFDAFQEELSNILTRQAQIGPAKLEVVE